MEIKIEIGGVEEQWLVDRVAQQVLQQYQQANGRAFDKAVAEAVNAGVAKQASEISKEKLLPLVDDVLVNGFTSSDGYGRSETKTVKQLIASYFAVGQYQSDSWVKRRLDEQFNTIMKAEFQPAIDAARKTLREKLDHILGEKVSLAVREAVGLR